MKAPKFRDWRLKTSTLEALIARGANVRSGRTLKTFRHMIPAITLTSIAQSSLYVLFMIRAARYDWENAALVMIHLIVANLISGFFLSKVRNQKSPITTSIVANAFMVLFAISLISAVRVPVSYQATALCGIISIFGIAWANRRAQEETHTRYALLEFKGANAVSQLFPFYLTVLGQSDVRLLNCDVVLVDSKAHAGNDYSAAIFRLQMAGVEIKQWHQHLENVTGRVDVHRFSIEDIVFSQSQLYYSFAKRIIDIIIVIIATPFALPFFLFIWTYIRILDGGPSLFIQERRGILGGTFKMYKFRTMRRNSEGGATQRNDERILPGCRILRQLRLDELPQMYNILRGEMSWIGPRPVSVEIAKRLEYQLPQYASRQLLRPGLTGWAQVNSGYASSIDEEVFKLTFDLFYVKNVSLDLDILIFIKTIGTIFFRSGAR